MSEANSKITIHMVASLDGYIAKPDESVTWMHATDTYDKGVTLSEAYIEDFLAAIDCYVMGSQTYELALEFGWPYGDKPVIVFTKRQMTSERSAVQFCNDDLAQYVNGNLRQQYKNIWMVGGSILTKVFLENQLADEIVITIVPIILGAGKPFFDHIKQETKLHLKDVTAFKNGMVELTYEIK